MISAGDSQPEVVNFLLSRRSRPFRMLRPPVPDAGQLRQLLTAAARVPDHGKLEPWKFIILETAALMRLAELARRRGTVLGKDTEQLDKAHEQMATGPLVVAVVASPKPSEKIPPMEQHLSAGAVCLSLLNVALASGWGANWLTGWMAYDQRFLKDGLALQPEEFVAGFIHIGSTTQTPPERPRPDVDALTSWVSS